CYALQNQVDPAIDYLQQAIALDPQWKDQAKTDTDFDSIRESDRFRALVGGGDPCGICEAARVDITE
ncbi:MAG: tetratricopeptide repeat protein, partial [Cyanobacteria bacterium CAN_BIN43]|nr:tetratricopeptide repeat protein [Cyanobacteria bacterium CAN_BIN43]